MKARHKDTGEIIELAEEGIISHDGRRFCWYQVELIPEPIDEFSPSLLNPTVDWSSFRREAAKDILAGAIAGGKVYAGSDKAGIVKFALDYTDELIKQLKQE